MVKFILGLVTGVILVFLSFVLLFFVLLRFREKPPEVGANSVLVLRLAGDIPEKAPARTARFPRRRQGPSHRGRIFTRFCAKPRPIPISAR